jgi:AbrB family looped-hinge helix DNA binding protein
MFIVIMYLIVATLLGWGASRKDDTKCFPSPLAGESAPKGRMRGSSRAQGLHFDSLNQPLIRLATRAAIHLLPQGEKKEPRNIKPTKGTTMTHLIATAKLGRTGQACIPKRIRQILALDPGDMLRFSRDGDAIILGKLDLAGLANPLAHITEWSDDDDVQTFAQL